MKTTAISTFQPVLECLFATGDDLIECRALPGKNRVFVRRGEWAAVQDFIGENPGQNIFFGVAARKDATSGRLENCSSIRALFADIDFKTFTNAVEARVRLEEFPLPPSIVIHSGGGLHVYWLLDAPVDLQQDSSEFRNILRRLASALNGDLAAAEAARVLRIPGTLNHKPEYDPPALVTVESHSNIRYSLDDFE